MKSSLLLGIFLVSTVCFSCKKDKGGDGNDPTKITTIEVAHVPATDGVYGEKYTFKMRFDVIGDVSEFGIVCKSHISDKSDKEPIIGDADSFKVLIGSSPSETGTILSTEATFSYAFFNDANYRAYAITDEGQIIYGEIMFISFA